MFYFKNNDLRMRVSEKNLKKKRNEKKSKINFGYLYDINLFFLTFYDKNIKQTLNSQATNKD